MEFVKLLHEQGLSATPDTVEVHVDGGRGGSHLYFRIGDTPMPRSTTSLFGTGAVARGSGVYVRGAGSVCGGLHEYAPGCAPDETGIAQLPEDWANHLLPYRSGKRRYCEPLST